MSKLLQRGGQLLGLLGILLMAISVITRVTGLYFVAGFQTGTFMAAGTAVVSVACFLLLLALLERMRG